MKTPLCDHQGKINTGTKIAANSTLYVLYVHAVPHMKDKVQKENKWGKIGEKSQRGNQKERSRGEKDHRVALFHRTH